MAKTATVNVWARVVRRGGDSSFVFPPPKLYWSKAIDDRTLGYILLVHSNKYTYSVEVGPRGAESDGTGVSLP